jgi:hypothetical protein
MPEASVAAGKANVGHPLQWIPAEQRITESHSFSIVLGGAAIESSGFSEDVQLIVTVDGVHLLERTDVGRDATQLGANELLALLPTIAEPPPQIPGQQAHAERISTRSFVVGPVSLLFEP